MSACSNESTKNKFGILGMLIGLLELQLKSEKCVVWLVMGCRISKNQSGKWCGVVMDYRIFFS